MALLVSIQTNSGFTASEAYIKVNHFNGSKDYISVSAIIYYNQQARIDDKLPLENLSFSIPTPTTGIMSAIYTHLKTLPVYAGATDI